jgi:general secretion pathway protein G
MQSNRSKSHRFDREAFTLIEVMLVLFILMVMAGIGIGAFRTYQKQANIREAKIFVSGMNTPLELYSQDHGSYPSTLEALLSPAEGVDPSKGSWPYIAKTAVKPDPWGSPYQYVCPGQQNPDEYDLWSLGPDRISGTDDDIGNW